MTDRFAKTKRFGFTITELVVVSVVMTTALLGVYTIFKQAIDVEAKASVKWNNHIAAEVVLDELSEALEYCVNLSEIKTLVGTPNGEEGEYVLKCFMEGKGYNAGKIDQVGLQQRRYTWTFQSDSSWAGMVFLQTMCYAGATNITSISGLTELNESNESEMWSRLPSRLIGKGLSALSIQFKSLESSDAKWQDNWNGPVGKVAVWIKVKVGDQTAERVVVPKNNTVTASPEGS